MRKLSLLFVLFLFAQLSTMAKVCQCSGEWAEAGQTFTVSYATYNNTCTTPTSGSALVQVYEYQLTFSWTSGFSYSPVIVRTFYVSMEAAASMYRSNCGGPIAGVLFIHSIQTKNQA